MFNIEIKNNNEYGPVVSSRTVASELGKEHKTVLRDIDNVFNSHSTDLESEIIPSEYTNNRGRKYREYLLTNKGLNLYMQYSSAPTQFKIANILKKYFDNENLNIYECERKEHKFGKLLKSIIKLDWQEQFPIDGGKYRLDFYSPNLIVEYDEKYHDYQTKEDDKRIKYCQRWIMENCNEDPFDEGSCPAIIRVKEGEELEGIARILGYLNESDTLRYAVNDASKSQPTYNHIVRCQEMLWN